VFLLVNREALTFSPWNTTVPIEWAVYASGNGTQTAIVADSLSSVIVLNANNELVYRLKAKPNKGESFSAVYFAELDEDNNLYILDLNAGGYREENVERLLKYSPKGAFVEELYAYRYVNTEFIITKGKLCGMAYFDGAVYLARLGDNDFTLERVAATNGGTTETVLLGVFKYPHAFRDIAFISINAERDRLTLTTKAGAIKQYDFKGILLYIQEPAMDSLPYTAVSGGDTDIAYADILAGDIVRINTGTGNRTVLWSSPGKESAYYRINYAVGTLFAAPYDQTTPAARLRDTASNVTRLDRYTYSKVDKILRVVFFGLALLDIVFFLVSFVSLIFFLVKIPKGKSVNTLILAVVFIALGVIISSTLIINEMDVRYHEKTFDGLENVSRLMVSSIDTGVLASITGPAQSESNAYLAFKKDLQTRFSQLQFRGKKVYQKIYREQNGMMFILYDLENSVGAFYPFVEYDDLYREVVSSKQYVHSQAVSPEGNWQLVCGPILNEQGEVVALIETGYDMRSMQGQTNKNIILWAWVLVDLVTAAILLVITEFILIFSYRRSR
jgi:hypothetical protein